VNTTLGFIQNVRLTGARRGGLLVGAFTRDTRLANVIAAGGGTMLQNGASSGRGGNVVQNATFANAPRDDVFQQITGAALAVSDRGPKLMMNILGLNAHFGLVNNSVFGRYVPYYENVAADTPLLVEDAHADPRFSDNPLVVRDPGVRFYAGFPVRSREGRPLGTLCVIDRAPWRLDPARVSLLEALARQVSLLLELRRNRLELAERRAAAALEQFFDVSLDLFCTADSTGHFRALNPAWERTLGFTPEELRARPVVELVHPEDRERTAREAAALYGERDVTVDFENRYLHKNGGYLTLQWSGRRAGELIYATARDVTAERERERALAESEGRLRAVLDGMAEGVVVQAASGGIIDANPAAEGILGLSRAQIEGRTSLDPRWRATREDGTDFPGQDHPAMVALRTGAPVTGALMGVHKPSGEVTWIRIDARPLHREGEAAAHAVVATFRDVTEDRRAAERARQLSQQERLVTTGTLAAGVGHEINNPLTYVLGNLEVAMEELRELGSGSASGRLLELVSTLDDARAGAERIRRIVRGLRALGRDDGPPVPTDVRTAVDLAVNMAMHELRQSATVRVDLGEVPPVLADESRLTQVFVNLLVNAAQAFRDRDPSRNRVTVSVRRDRRTVVVSVADNGPGIAPEVLPRIYDPFFTTKPVGVGTGLGLAISHSIVSALAGELLCESTPGEGTTFHVRLPTAASASLIPGALSSGAVQGRPACSSWTTSRTWSARSPGCCAPSTT